MRKSNIDSVVSPVPQVQDAMTEILREGARKLLGEMIQQEVENWLAERAHLRDEQGRRQVVCNGYEAKYSKAVECLTKDRDVLLAFYDFPAEHWGHLRTTNPIESTFATVRLRTKRTKGSGSRAACLAMVYKLMQSASKKWRLLNGSKILVEVLKGTVFVDGILVPQVAA